MNIASSIRPNSSPRPFLIWEANYRQLLEYRPKVAVLPWGATEAHNFHLPHGTDTIQATEFAAAAAAIAYEAGAAPIVLPPVPFGNNAQQLDQVATIHCSTQTAMSILRDVAQSLLKQDISRFVILNAHGGNEFKPLVRDLQLEFELLVVVVNFWKVVPEQRSQIFDDLGDHADEMETSLMLHLCPEWVELNRAGPGERIPFDLKTIGETNAWTPRPWSKSHPDTGSGNPTAATADKGKRYFQAVVLQIAKLLTELSQAASGQLPL